MQNKEMRPTAKIRWLQIHMADLGPHHQSAIDAGHSNLVRVLQQWWEPATEFEFDARKNEGIGEWRVIPIESS